MHAKRLLAVATTALLLGLIPASALASATKVTVKSGGCTHGGSEFCYSPEKASLDVKNSVTWVNQSGVAHTVTLCTPSACPGAPNSTGKDTFNLSLGAGAGSKASHTFKTAGVYYYYCRIHGYAAMHGEIVVQSSS